MLEYLASNPGQVVERETLLNGIWEGRAFSDEPLSRCIFELRHALGDSSKDPKYIETIPKSGYRLICTVESLVDATDDASKHLGEQSVVHNWGILTGRRRIALPAFLGLILIAAVYLAYRSMLINTTESPQLTAEGTTQSEPPVYSIAVLPFRNRSAESEDAFFVDGIHDDIVTRLARLSSLERVISRTSVERYRDTDKSMQQIGHELGVAIVLEGSVQRAGDRVRINVQLIDAATDDHLWVESYDRQLTVENLFAIQSEISREIVGALQLVLTDEENERLRAMPTTSFEAYGEFVLGRQEMDKGTTDSFSRAKVHFEKAIELDPNYALAYAALADALGQYSNNVGLVNEFIAPRQKAVDRALALDPLSGEAYTSLGFLKRQDITAEYGEPETYFLKAIELSPNYARAYSGYALELTNNDRDEEALATIRKAVELDPMDPDLTAGLAIRLSSARLVEESEAVLLKGLERNPDYPLHYSYMGIHLASLGRIGEALQWHHAASRLDPSNVSFQTNECLLYLNLGDDQAAERCIDSFEQAYRANERPSFRWVLYDFRHQYQKAVDVLEQLAQQAEPNNADVMEYVMERLGRRYLNTGDVDKARSIWQELAPELYGDEDVVVKPDDVAKTAYVAYTLHIDGELDRANYLFDQALDTMQSMHRLMGPGYVTLDIFIHVTRGEKQKAISALREAINEGWRYGWWRLNSPFYDSMRGEPEWIELLTELEADIARQREWYEKHKDDPLF